MGSAHVDAPHPSGNDRYAIYAVLRDRRTGDRRRVAETSLEGIGVTIVTLTDEGEFEGCRVGVLDRETRDWLVNPF